MSANELAAWLIAHRHDDVTVHDESHVRSTLNGKRRSYELVPAVTSPGSLLGDVERTAYWKRVAP